MSLRAAILTCIDLLHHFLRKAPTDNEYLRRAEALMNFVYILVYTLGPSSLTTPSTSRIFVFEQQRRALWTVISNSIGILIKAPQLIQGHPPCDCKDSFVMFKESNSEKVRCFKCYLGRGKAGSIIAKQ